MQYFVLLMGLAGLGFGVFQNRGIAAAYFMGGLVCIALFLAHDTGSIDLPLGQSAPFSNQAVAPARPPEHWSKKRDVVRDDMKGCFYD